MWIYHYPSKINVAYYLTKACGVSLGIFIDPLLLWSLITGLLLQMYPLFVFKCAATKYGPLIRDLV